MTAHISLSFELISLITWIIKNERNLLNNLVKQAVEHGFAEELNNVQTVPDPKTVNDHMAHNVLDFLEFLEDIDKEGMVRQSGQEIAQIELVGSEYDPKAAPKDTKAAAEPPKSKGVGGRLRAAADRLRGKKSDVEGGEPGGKNAGRAPSGKSRTVKRTPQKSG